MSNEPNDLQWRRSQALQFFGPGEAVDAIDKLIAKKQKEAEESDD